jgi:hypothetical protein
VTFQFKPDVRRAFGYSPPARFLFDDPEPTAAEGVKPRVSNVALEAAAAVDDVYPHLRVIDLGFHRYLSLPVKHSVVYKLAHD